MKPQDLIFILALLIIFWQRRPKLAVWLGLGALALAIPLFSLKTALFTAERLTWYSAGFFLTAIILLKLKGQKK